MHLIKIFTKLMYSIVDSISRNGLDMHMYKKGKKLSPGTILRVHITKLEFLAHFLHVHVPTIASPKNVPYT